MVAVSAWVTPEPSVTAQESLRLLMGVLLAFSLVRGLDSERWLRGALIIVLLLALMMAASGLLTIDWADKYPFLPQLTKLLPRLQSALDTAVNPNLEGGFLAIFLTGLLAWLVFNWKELSQLVRLGWVFVAVFIGVVLFLTQARAALLALAAGTSLLVILRCRRGWISIVLGFSVTLALIFYLGPQQVWYSLGNNTGGVVDFTRREDIWLRAKLTIRDFPITGVGMGTFSDVVDMVYPLAQQPVHVGHAHNLFLQIAVDLGLPGLLSWLGCWGILLWTSWRLFCSKIMLWRALGAAALCSQVALGVGGLLDSAVWDNRPAVIIWGLWGIILAADKVRFSGISFLDI
jgi:putative inorganic carbon (HCO3(-)) transporter